MPNYGISCARPPSVPVCAVQAFGSREEKGPDGKIGIFSAFHRQPATANLLNSTGHVFAIIAPLRFRHTKASEKSLRR